MPERNLREKKWVLSALPCESEANNEICRLAEDCNLTAVMAKLLYTRGYRTKREVVSFLHQDEASFHDPYILQDMEAAVTRIQSAVENGEKIAIYGDYDVDGVTSVSLLYLYLKEKGADVGYYIPSRMREGYGISKAAVKHLKECGTTLMITVDTGITAMEEIAYAKELGIDTVVTDHHECRAELPSAVAVVNPHRQDDTYPFPEIAGVGVIFKVICGMEMAECRKQGLPTVNGVMNICRKYADLVAIGTIADVMPIVDENRLIVSLGLSIIEKNPRMGISALMKAASGKNNAENKKSKKRPVNSSFIGYVIAPRMNAAGRVSDASIAVELLLSDNPERAEALADELCALNLQRQVEENRIAEQAMRKIDEMPEDERRRVIVLDDDTWQQGIIGIVSSRITEKYGLPSILISFDGATLGFAEGDDVGKGSGRSIKGLNLVGALTECEDLLVRFGGHELAAGLSVRRRDIPAFRRKINQYAEDCLSEEMLCQTLNADCEVKIEELSMQLANEISMLEPFGVSNPVPVFVLRDAKLVHIIPMSGGKHTKLILEKDGREITAIRFGMSPSELSVDLYDPVDVMFQLSVNEFQNTVSLQMILEDIRHSETKQILYRKEQERYEQIRAGASYNEKENILPGREDIAAIYTWLRREFRMGHTVFSLHRILTLFARQGICGIGYSKLKFSIRIMQELNICGVTETSPDTYVFDFYFNPSKTNIEKSSILHCLRGQLRRTEESN